MLFHTLIISNGHYCMYKSNGKDTKIQCINQLMEVHDIVTLPKIKLAATGYRAIISRRSITQPKIDSSDIKIRFK